ncbi:TIGR03364 family FAD-dependent oxidoreductase [Microbacterium sp. W1N]|uniref:TIGR03364 family FAD-dependent oxidoreductase n=1 Tax=Microbacterium festucae TaxID=2977531 RepID=UPI0021BE94FA|nr:TIGR03364 family FAD-dependent oxidoreductase [Microbacterium festucae]MCT9820501.1 TIGR03364 family FAD-dependent oxidoreductase [Microbacterium festucae]
MSSTADFASGPLLADVDLVVIGAGIVGLAHAYEGWRQGLRVAVVDRRSAAAGASVRNFGHACVTPQSGEAAEFAAEARRRWLELSEAAGFWARESGTAVVARSAPEAALLEQYAAAYDGIRLWDAATAAAEVPVTGAVAGAVLPADLQVDPREAVGAIAAWLEARGVQLHWRTSAHLIETGRVGTSRGVIRAERVIVAVNHDVDELFPELATATGTARCRLHMLRARVGLAFPLTRPLFTGWSLLRYSGFATMPAADELRAQLARELPQGIEYDLNLMFTPQRDGSLLIGDTHERGIADIPFQSEAGFDLVIDQTRRLFGAAQIEVVERWQGVYATAPGREFLIHDPMPGVTVVVVTTGIGMTTALGIAPQVLAGVPAL